jgi:eukaryotic-like serine/threonine-protein kinase
MVTTLLELSKNDDRYRLTTLVGRGGMAEVYAGYSLGAAGFERPVCVKQVIADGRSDRRFRDLFLREIRLAGRLCHSNLVQVFDCIEGQREGRIGLVMELVDGLNLKAMILGLRQRGQATPQGLVGYIAGQMLAGLRFAHGQRIIHRDISPHNILVSRQGEVKIADFGVAKAMSSLASRTGKVQGKLAYMSPEQAGGKDVDHRTDLYSMGLVLYELLTGERFFGRAPRWSLLYEVAKAKQPRLLGADPALARLIEGLLAPNPAARFQSADEALCALPAWEVIGPRGARELAALVDELAGEPISPEPFDGAKTEPAEPRPRQVFYPALPKTLSEQGSGDAWPATSQGAAGAIDAIDDRETTPTPRPTMTAPLTETMAVAAVVRADRRGKGTLLFVVMALLLPLVALAAGLSVGFWLRTTMAG